MTAPRRVPAAQRRALLVRRHRLDGSASGVDEVLDALLALHATDPASIHLAVLARSRGTTIADVDRALAAADGPVRWMAMRRTLFVLRREDVPTVQAAIGVPLAAALRRRLLSRLERNGVDPSPGPDLPAWLAGLEQEVRRVLDERGTATGGELRRAVPGLGAVIRARAASEAPQAITSPLLTLLGTEGSIVRAAPVGSWTTRHQRWAPASAWWPDGLPDVDEGEARVALARAWLQRFGPAAPEDLQWWTGWPKGTTAAALASLPVEHVDLDGVPGIDLPRDEPADPMPPSACLLPALDPTPMGWRERGWFTAADEGELVDRSRNLGPTVWWDGEIVGGWASTPSGVRTALLVDRGREAELAVEAAAAALHERLQGAVVVPSFRTPLEQRLRGTG